jgi:hypothetical protein
MPRCRRHAFDFTPRHASVTRRFSLSAILRFDAAGFRLPLMPPADIAT